MRIIAEISSQILECLNFTWDSPTKNDSQKLPVLDTKLWVAVESREKGNPKEIGHFPRILKPGVLKKIVYFEFYKKPMANPCLNLKRSGIPDGS